MRSIISKRFWRAVRLPWMGMKNRRLLGLGCGLVVFGTVLFSPAAEAGHRYPHHYYPRSYVSLSFGYPYYYPYYYGGYYAYAPPYYAVVSPDMGAIDLAVKPKKAAVYLDGQHIGVVKNYDGYPRYLWLEKGNHQLVFYLQGYRTHVETVRVQPGVVLKLKYKMTAGQATPPEAVFAPSQAPAEPAPVATRERSEGPPPTAAGRDESWRERGAVERDVRATPGLVRIRVEPGDAVVYLDGRLIGSGEEIGRLHAPLVVDPGAHTLEIARPGYRTERLEVDAIPGEEVWLEISLEPTAR